MDAPSLSRAPTAPGCISASSSFASLDGKPQYGETSAAPLEFGDLMTKLDTDSVLQVAHFLGTGGVLALCAVCHEWGRVFQQAVLRLRISLVSLSGAPLERVLPPLIRRLPAITEVDLSYSNATDFDVKLLGELLSSSGSYGASVRALRLNQCDQLTDASMQSIALTMGGLQARTTRLFPCPPCPSRPQPCASPRSARRLPSRTASVPTPLSCVRSAAQTLELVGCRDVTDRGVAALLRGCGRLRGLHLGWCGVSNRGVAMVAARLHASLTALDISGCARVTDAGVTHLVSRCRLLKVLLLEGCREVSGWAVAGAASQLESLALGGCTLVTDAGVGALTHSCRHLVSLCLRQVRPPRAAPSPRRRPPSAPLGASLSLTLVPALRTPNP